MNSGTGMERIERSISGWCSMRFTPCRRATLETKVRERMRDLNVGALDDYVRLVMEERGEFQNLIEGILTRETYFFRIPEHFRILANSVVPEIEERLGRELHLNGNGSWTNGAARAALRVWSAGCSTGEEVYSLAMTLLESLKYPRAWRVEITATDLSREAIERAHRGYYEHASLHRVPSEMRSRYWAAVPGGVSAHPDIQRLLAFRLHNLRCLEDDLNGMACFERLDGVLEAVNIRERFDIIFCRNVMIYFGFEAQQRLVNALFRALKPGGYLFTGDAEVLHLYDHPFEPVELEDSLCYRKPSGDTNDERGIR